MGIESTHMVRRSDAILMLKIKRIQVFQNDCNERLEVLLYENKESDTENYWVCDDDYEGDQYERWKTCW
jgi:hypothetical protein